MKHKKNATVKNANVLSRSFQHKLRNFILMSLSIGFFVFGCATIAHNEESSSFVQLRPETVNMINEDFGGKEQVVFFAVDKEGHVTPMGSKAVAKSRMPFKLPATEVKLLDLETFTLITLNPKICWINSSGDKECVRY